jgi:hypothetical protein
VPPVEFIVAPPGVPPPDVPSGREPDPEEVVLGTLKLFMGKRRPSFPAYRTNRLLHSATRYQFLVCRFRGPFWRSVSRWMMVEKRFWHNLSENTRRLSAAHAS